MNSVILCEGFDDALFLGYFIHKTSDESKWIYNNKARISVNFSLQNFNSETEKVEIYTRKGSDDKVVIWAVGGKDNFGHVIEHISELNNTFPKERFENIIIVSDRDNDDVEQVIDKFSGLMKNYEVEGRLRNSTINAAKIDVDGEEYPINIVPIIIPFDEEGAIETVLMHSLKNSSEQDGYVVTAAKDYILQIVENPHITRYLTKSRQRIKGEFSSMIAVMNPDRSTGKMNAILLTHEWEKKEEIIRHFGIINECLNK